jgi:hypothetical protein
MGNFCIKITKLTSIVGNFFRWNLYMYKNLTLSLREIWQDFKSLTSYIRYFCIQELIQETLYKAEVQSVGHD